MRRTQTLTKFQGHLVPIGELDRAKDLPVREVEVIDLTGECQGNPCTLQLQTSPRTSVLGRGSDRQSAGSVDRKT